MNSRHTGSFLRIGLGRFQQAVIVVLAAISVSSCTRSELEERCPCTDWQPELEAIEATWVSGAIGANAMPIVPPDPIDCSFSIRLENVSEFRACGMRIPSAAVKLTDLDSLLGIIPIGWAGEIECYSVDTVSYRKWARSSENATFPPVCGQNVAIQFHLVNLYQDTLFVDSDTLVFSCSF